MSGGPSSRIGLTMDLLQFPGRGGAQLAYRETARSARLPPDVA